MTESEEFRHHLDDIFLNEFKIKVINRPALCIMIVERMDTQSVNWDARLRRLEKWIRSEVAAERLFMVSGKYGGIYREFNDLPKAAQERFLEKKNAPIKTNWKNVGPMNRHDLYQDMESIAKEAEEIANAKVYGPSESYSHQVYADSVRAAIEYLKK